MTASQDHATRLVPAFFAGFHAPAPCSVVEWAERERWLPGSVTAKPGPYRAEVTPYATAWMESFTDPAVQTTVIMAAKRCGKTEVLFNLVGHQMSSNPRNVLMVYPTLDSAKKSSKQFFMPMVRASKDLSWRVKDSRQRGAGNTIHAKEFPGGVISFIGSNSPTAFRQVQAPVVIGDEIDAMDASKEGDPITLMFGRSENYSDCIQVLSSTPTIKDQSRIESWYNRSDKQNWHVCCKNKKCQAHDFGWVLAWKDVQWPDQEPQNAVLVCPFCKEIHSDQDRFKAVLGGKWKATAPFHGIRGYWLNGLNSPFPAKKGFTSKLHQFASEFIDAKAGGTASIQAWTNTFLAETFAIVGDQHEASDFTARCENYAPDLLPDGVLVLTAGVDTQKDRLEAEIIGFGNGFESWGIERVKILGDTMLPDVWAKLHAWLDREFQHPCGAKMRVQRAHIDSGGSTPGITKSVYRFCGSSGKPFYAIKGSSNPMREPIAEAKRRSRLLIVDTIYFKNQVFEWLEIQKTGPRYQHFPKTYDDEFFAQLCAERRTVKFIKGQPRYTWEVVRGNKRNEAFDIRQYAYSAAYALNPNWEAAKKWRDKEAAKKTPIARGVPGREDKPHAAPEHRPRVRIGGMKSMGGMSGLGKLGRI